MNSSESMKKNLILKIHGIKESFEEIKQENTTKKYIFSDELNPDLITEKNNMIVVCRNKDFTSVKQPETIIKTVIDDKNKLQPITVFSPQVCEKFAQFSGLEFKNHDKGLGFSIGEFSWFESQEIPDLPFEVKEDKEFNFHENTKEALENIENLNNAENEITFEEIDEETLEKLTNPSED